MFHDGRPAHRCPSPEADARRAAGGRGGARRRPRRWPSAPWPTSPTGPAPAAPRRAPGRQARLRRLRRAAGRGPGRAGPAAAARGRAHPGGAPGDDVVARSLAVELENVRRHARRASRPTPSTPSSTCWPTPPTASRCWRARPRGASACVLADELAMLRSGVELVSGTDVRLGRILGVLTDGDVLVVIDLRRYERWVLEHHRAGPRARRPRRGDVRPRPVAAGRRGLAHVRGAGRGRRAVRQPRRHPGPRQRPAGRRRHAAARRRPPTASTASRRRGATSGALIDG